MAMKARRRKQCGKSTVPLRFGHRLKGRQVKKRSIIGEKTKNTPRTKGWGVKDRHVAQTEKE